MSKRFHDTEIWKQDWFLELSYEYMLLWLYIKDTCDHAGIWKPNKRFIEFISGKPIDLKKAVELFNATKNRIEILSNGRWLIPDFIAFQYGNHLNVENRVHASIVEVLENNGVPLTSLRGLVEDNDRVKDKAKDKDKKIKMVLTDTDFIASLKSSIAYKHINIDIELARMDAWLLAHKGKQKTRRFIVNWLNRIEKGLPISEASQVSYQEKNKKPDPNCPLCGGKGKRYPNPNNKEISVACNCWR